MIDNFDPLTDTVQRFFGLPYLFPYQRLVISNILEAATAVGIPIHWPQEDQDMAQAWESDEGLERESCGLQIIILPTGAGKSLCFQVPAMLLGGATLVIYPLLSLMADQERRLRERGFTPLVLCGGQAAERDAVWEAARSGKSRFIIANPEVLLSGQAMDKLGTLGIVHVVIDEAHCVSEWGESFRPSYLEITKIIRATKAPLVSAFTATASTLVLEKIEQYVFDGRMARRIIGNPDRSNISYAAQGCILRDLAVRDLIIRNERPAIVFCSSRTGTEQLARYLRSQSQDDQSWRDSSQGAATDACTDTCAVSSPPLLPADVRFYHAGLTRDEKRDVEQWFFNNPRGVLVATCAYGMGVDKADIRTVIHRDCPPSVEAYLQESGRAGRDSLPSKSILLWGPDDERRFTRAASEMEHQRFAALFTYARDTSVCRRRALLDLLNYDGENETPVSMCCDVCEGKAQQSMRETPLLDFFKRNRRRYTITQAAVMLAKCKHYSWTTDDVKQAIQGFISMKQLKVSKNILWKNKLTDEHG
ncbi:MAG: DEAD/DEAH box helicase [Treponema sp.]|nr:DEAD/DEAH box helicase [Treponema sp.]